MVTIERGCAGSLRSAPSKSLRKAASHSYSHTLSCCAMTEGEEIEFGWLGSKPKRAAASTALASAAGAFSGFFRWSYALAEQHILQPAYLPQFFSSSQYQTVESQSSSCRQPRMPPARRSPGPAKPGSQNSSMVFSDPSLQPEFRHGFDHAAAPAPTFFQSAPRSNMRSSNGSPTKPISGKRRKPGNSSSASSAGTQS